VARANGDTTLELEESQNPGRRRNLPVLDWVFPERVAGTRVQLAHGATLGRADTASVRLDGEGVSREHAEVLREGPALTVRDTGSTNGTFLNGRRVLHATVPDGATLRIGGWLGVFGWAAAGESVSEAFSLVAPGFWGGQVLRLALEPGRRAAPSNLPLLLAGETGTGKELCARALHGWSGRSGRFTAVNCAALPLELAEAELFGYCRGAFTGALKDKVGYFQSAHQGTLFLDEIAELPLAIQAKLLRAIQEQAVTPLGQAQPLPVDVRLIAASQAPLARAVAAGKFREDLFMRLKGLQIELPALRDRRVDVAPLLRKFLDRGSGGEQRTPELDVRGVEALSLYRWPGNVRELELVARRWLAVHGDEPTLKLEHLPAEILEGNVEGESRTPPAPDRASDDLDRLARKLRENGGNLSRACKELEISRQRAYRLLAGQSVQEFLAGRR
jgi:transcriptional regulator of acetoin/glycerol metabolism